MKGRRVCVRERLTLYAALFSFFGLPMFVQTSAKRKTEKIKTSLRLCGCPTIIAKRTKNGKNRISKRISRTSSFWLDYYFDIFLREKKKTRATLCIRFPIRFTRLRWMIDDFGEIFSICVGLSISANEEISTKVHLQWRPPRVLLPTVNSFVSSFID